VADTTPAARPGRGEPAPARPGSPQSGEPAHSGNQLDRRAFGALADLRDAGLIRHLGISNVGPEQLAEARAIAPAVCVQNRYDIGSPPLALTTC
jgi:aryl-alcohol dehydrogenase-like predicted oxidoreductase